MTEPDLPSLGGMLASRRKTADPDVIVKIEEDAAPASATATQLDEGEFRGGTGDVGDGLVEEQIYLVPRQVYLPRSTHANAKRYGLETGMSVTEMIVTAVSDMHAAVGPYLRHERDQQRKTEGSGIYPIPQSRRRKRTADSQVQTSVRITDLQLDVMDKLAQRYGINRSKLLAVCLRLWLLEKIPSGSW